MSAQNDSEVAEEILLVLVFGYISHCGGSLLNSVMGSYAGTQST